MANLGEKSNIKSFVIQAAKDEGRGIDVKTGIVAFSYYESILSNNITAALKVFDTGNSITDPEDKKKLVSIVEGLPIRGGEKVLFNIRR